MTSFADELSLLVLTCVKEPLSQFRDRIIERLFSSTDSRWSAKEGPLECKAIYYPRPQRGGAQPLSVAIWSPRCRPDISVFYPNSSCGWSHFIGKLSKAGMID